MAPVNCKISHTSYSTFDDIDAQAAALGGWNQQYMQTSAGAFFGNVARMHWDGISLFTESLTQSVHQTGYIAPHTVALGVPLAQSTQAYFCGRSSDAQHLHVFSGASGFEFRTPQHHTMLGIEIDRPLFDTLVADTQHGASAALGASAGLHSVRSAALAELGRFAAACFDSSAQSLNASQSSQLRDALLERIAYALAPAEPTPHSALHGKAESKHHTALAARANGYLASRLDNPPTVQDMCCALQVSRRTLQSCFQATKGMGPLAWLNTLRLNAARRQLKTATSVTQAATEFGYWHFGHFANDYQALFGELPSHTLGRYRKLH